MRTKITLSLILALFSVGAVSSPITVDVISAPQGLTIQNKLANITFPTNQVTESVMTQGNAVAVTNKTFDQTSNVAKQAYGVYDFSVNGGASNGRISLGMALPNKAIITSAIIDTITQPTSTSTPTIAISCASAGDIIAAHTIAGWTVGRGLGVPVGSSATMIKLAAATNCSVDLGTTDLTAGKFTVYLNYLISQ